ncbi:MAG: metallophosphoesterase [Candidatus Thorarchaeota archaeon]|nr:metallophosphoesterase [Candidatus Thorarchaeota archaeon]
MRLAAVSDIHVRPDGSDAGLLRELKTRIEELGPDALVVAGDISSHLTVLRETLSALAMGIPCLYVAGNHDIWFEKETNQGSLEKYSRLIGEACRQTGWTHLPDGSYVMGDVAFIGSIGWSDYSFRREELGIPLRNYEMKEYRGSTWFDLFQVDWDFTDVEATNLFNRKIAYDLSTLPRHVKHVVYVSHHLPFRELTLYKDRLPWDFFSAYMGARSTGELLRQDKRVILTISGHSHIRNVVRLNGITAVSVPVGYGRPEEAGLAEFARKAVACIDIDGSEVKLLDFVRGDICEGLPYGVSD